MEIEECQEEAIRLNTNEQLFLKGVLADGTSTGSYSPNTIPLKKRSGLPWKHVTFYQTGKFHSGWDINLAHGEFTLHAPDNYMISSSSKNGGGQDNLRHKLLQHYGDFEGLTPESTSSLAEFITPKVSEYFLNTVLW
ncbi:MAG: hypothetical protein IPL70_09220 [Uliginosibacterium sp.]|nr:hypothetical protein [Uliginosibacterium sp.]